jgi:hypothetical protein
MKMEIEFEPPQPVGEVELAEGKLEFPQLPQQPGIYVMEFTDGKQDTLYVGETEQLHQRMAHYRNPGPSQMTNIRLNTAIKAHIAISGRIRVGIITMAHVDGVRLDLGTKVARLLVENALLLVEQRAGRKVENL